MTELQGMIFLIVVSGVFVSALHIREIHRERKAKDPKLGGSGK